MPGESSFKSDIVLPEVWEMGVWVGLWAVGCGAGFTISYGSQRPWHGLLVDAALSGGGVVFLVV